MCVVNSALGCCRHAAHVSISPTFSEGGAVGRQSSQNIHSAIIITSPKVPGWDVKMVSKLIQLAVVITLLTMLGTECHAVTISLSNPQRIQVPELARDGLVVTGSGPLSLNNGGLGVAGGAANGEVDGGEFVTFVFQVPAINIRYTGRIATDWSNDGFGTDRRLEAFDAAGNSLGVFTQQFPPLVDASIPWVSVSSLYGNAPIKSFRLTAYKADGFNVSVIEFETAPTPTPLPEAAVLFASGLAGLQLLTRRRRSAAR